MADPKPDDDLALYMATNPKESPNDAERVAFKRKRHQDVRDLYKYRRLEKEEFESYRDKDYRDSQINKLQGQFRDNYIERLTVVTTLRAMGHEVVDDLIPLTRPGPSDQVEEAEVLTYMAQEGPPSELPSEEDRKIYFQKRYVAVKEGYWYLKLQQEEAEQYKDKAYREKLMDKLKALYRKNQTERIAVVVALRRIGVPVDDPFVPLSKI
jgi:hypothetical protein